MVTVFKNATLIHANNRDSLEFLRNKTIIINQNKGEIIEILPSSASIEKYYIKEESYQEYTLSSSQILIPGLVDTHVHAPQYCFTGTGLDLPLLDWLKKYTFPWESRFSDIEFAKRIYTQSVNSHIKHGTTTICYFATIHLEATKILAQILQKSGIRSFVGKVCMDQNSPDYYIEESTKTSLNETREFISYISNNNFTRVVPVVTPRFAPTCSSNLLTGLGKIAAQYQTFIQTHMSENKAEIAWIKELFPECHSYAEVYNKYSLLNSKTILGHCIYLTEDEIKLIKKTGAGIAHCPNSNTFLQSGIMPARNLMKKDVKIGLGTDVAGGYSTSMFDAIRQCIGVSKLYAVEHPGTDPLTLAETFYLATRGGASLVGLENSIGLFQKGYQFDALLLDYCQLDCWTDDVPLEELFEKIIYLSDDRHIKKVFVGGRLIHSIE